MPERDAEGRPIATRNAGAFLAPVGGVVPAPSSILDEDGGAAPPVGPAGRGRLAFALATSISIWALLTAMFRYLLAATERAAEVRALTYGDHMTQIMHTDWAWLATNAAIVAVGIVMATRRLPDRRRSDWVFVIAGSLAGAILIGIAVDLIGGLAAFIAAIAAAAWLVVAYIVRTSAHRSLAS